MVSDGRLRELEPGRYDLGRHSGIEIAEDEDDALILAVAVCIDQMSHNVR